MSYPDWLRRSLYARSLSFIAVAAVLGSASLSAAAYYYAQISADEAYDQMLTFGVVQIAENLFVQGGVVALDPPVAAFASLSAHDLVFYNIVDPRGIVVAGHSNLPAHIASEAKIGPSLTTATYQGQDIRIATLARHLSDAPLDGWIMVTLAQTRNARNAFARELARKASLVIIVMGCLIVVTGAVAIRFALAPLTRVEKALALRDPNDLQPLDVDTPHEIRALIYSIDALMSRLSQRMAGMQRFIADCAHQIRTPLAALDGQIELLSGEISSDAGALRIEKVRQRSGELARLTGQLLGHAMVNHRAAAELSSPVDLVALCRAVLANVVPLSLDREINIVFTATDAAITINGDALSIREALSNLVHNAIVHGATSYLALHVKHDHRTMSILVADDGKGIAPEEWRRLCKPFTSGRSATAVSGLGLAIASDVMKSHAGEITMAYDSSGYFNVIMTFPSTAKAIS